MVYNFKLGGEPRTCAVPPSNFVGIRSVGDCVAIKGRLSKFKYLMRESGFLVNGWSLAWQPNYVIKCLMNNDEHNRAVESAEGTYL